MSASILLLAVHWKMYFDSYCHFLQFRYTFCRTYTTSYASNKKIGNIYYQNNNQYVSLIPKWDPGITNFSIPNPGIPINKYVGPYLLGELYLKNDGRPLMMSRKQSVQSVTITYIIECTYTHIFITVAAYTCFQK